MQLTGNPFVDAGLGIAAAKAGHSSVNRLTRDGLQRATEALHRRIESLRDMKLLAAFWVNNPFMGKNLGQKAKFESFLTGLAQGSLATKPGNCQICGCSPVLAQDVDRCWFPLAGGKNSDPSTLPSLKGKFLCHNCLSAGVILPLGCMHCSDGPFLVHVASPESQVAAVTEGVAAVNAGLAAKSPVSIRHNTRLKGRPALLEIATGSVLWDHSQSGHMHCIPESGATMASFSNRGEGPCLYQLHLPADALKFFGAMFEHRLNQVFMSWAYEIQKNDKGMSRGRLLDKLCEDIEQRQSLGPLLVVLTRPRKTAGLTEEERKVLAIYEDVALGKKERFDTLQRIASKVNQMPARYSESFVKRLGNLGQKRTLVELIKDFSKRDPGLRLTNRELRVIDNGPNYEVASLLYLLCIADEENDNL